MKCPRVPTKPSHNSTLAAPRTQESGCVGRSLPDAAPFRRRREKVSCESIDRYCISRGYTPVRQQMPSEARFTLKDFFIHERVAMYQHGVWTSRGRSTRGNAQRVWVQRSTPCDIWLGQPGRTLHTHATRESNGAKPSRSYRRTAGWLALSTAHVMDQPERARLCRTRVASVSIARRIRSSP